MAFLHGVGISRATLVGHSASGFIARRVAETHPDRVARLVPEQVVDDLDAFMRAA